MLLKRIIPCLDVDKGRVVKGVRYVDHVDAGDPVEVARMYDAQEADEITFLDITAYHTEHPMIPSVGDQHPPIRKHSNTSWMIELGEFGIKIDAIISTPVSSLLAGPGEPIDC